MKGATPAMKVATLALSISIHAVGVAIHRERDESTTCMHRDPEARPQWGIGRPVTILQC
jgi:hypothetical protein